MSAELCLKTAVELRALVASRAVSPVEIVDAVRMEWTDRGWIAVLQVVSLATGKEWVLLPVFGQSLELERAARRIAAIA